MTPVHVGFEITPLTHRRRDGRVYTRREIVTRQLEELSKSSEDVITRRISVAQEEDPDSIKSESLVFLFRYYRDTGIAALIFETLALRIRRLVRKAGNSYSLNETDFEDLFQEMNLKVLEKISEDGDDGDYAQVSFGPFVLGLAGNYLKAFANERSWGALVDSIDETFEDTADSPPRIQIASLGVSEDDRLFISETIEGLSEPYRSTWMMYHEQGYQIESNDPEEKTIASHFGVTGRTVRNRLHHASEIINKLNRGL